MTSAHRDATCREHARIKREDLFDVFKAAQRR